MELGFRRVVPQVLQMRSDKRTTGKAEAQQVAPADESGLLRDWRETASELSNIDKVMEELREELRRFEVRRKMIATKEASMRRLLADQGIQLNTDLKEAERAGTQQLPTSAVSAPHVFSLDEDADQSPTSLNGADRAGSSPSSMEDWEHGLEVLNSVGSRDRAAKLRAHMLVASTKQAPSKPVARAQMDAVELLQTAIASRCQ